MRETDELANNNANAPALKKIIDKNDGKSGCCDDEFYYQQAVQPDQFPSKDR